MGQGIHLGRQRDELDLSQKVLSCNTYLNFRTQNDESIAIIAQAKDASKLVHSQFSNISDF